MKNYFISKGLGRLEAGKTVYWKFPEFPIDSPVRVKAVDPSSFISFAWESVDGRDC